MRPEENSVELDKVAIVGSEQEDARHTEGERVRLDQVAGARPGQGEEARPGEGEEVRPGEGEEPGERGEGDGRPVEREEGRPGEGEAVPLDEGEGGRWGGDEVEDLEEEEAEQEEGSELNNFLTSAGKLAI